MKIQIETLPVVGYRVVGDGVQTIHPFLSSKQELLDYLRKIVPENKGVDYGKNQDV